MDLPRRRSQRNRPVMDALWSVTAEGSRHFDESRLHEGRPILCGDAASCPQSVQRDRYFSSPFTQSSVATNWPAFPAATT